MKCEIMNKYQTSRLFLGQTIILPSEYLAPVLQLTLYEHQQAKSTFHSCNLRGTLANACARSQPTKHPWQHYSLFRWQTNFTKTELYLKSLEQTQGQSSLRLAWLSNNWPHICVFNIEYSRTHECWQLGTRHSHLAMPPLSLSLSDQIGQSACTMRRVPCRIVVSSAHLCLSSPGNLFNIEELPREVLNSGKENDSDRIALRKGMNEKFASYSILVLLSSWVCPLCEESLHHHVATYTAEKVVVTIAQDIIDIFKMRRRRKGVDNNTSKLLLISALVRSRRVQWVMPHVLNSTNVRVSCKHLWKLLSGFCEL